ncbi:MAG: hypothetical protein ACLRNZ_01565 [Blautia massiliensis (ex Durand et al. 2017)]
MPGSFSRLFIKGCLAAEIPEIRDTAISMLISYARNRGEYSKAEELINMLPFSAIDREEQLAILHRLSSKKCEDAKKNMGSYGVLKGAGRYTNTSLNIICLK